MANNNKEQNKFLSHLYRQKSQKLSCQILTLQLKVPRFITITQCTH